MNTNQNSCKNYQMSMINSFLLNIPEFLDENNPFDDRTNRCND